MNGHPEANTISVNGRIEVERVRLGLDINKVAIAVGGLGGSSSEPRLNVDWPRLNPSACGLQELDRLGMDVLFIVTGRRA